MFFEFDDYELLKAKIKVLGVGGAGGNAINRMIEDNLGGVEFIAINTDSQDLENNLAEVKLQIGKTTTKGLGAGAEVSRGTEAVEEDHDLIEQTIGPADMVFITAGMGGGTGTGAAPSIAKIARDLGCLTVGIVTRPFVFEGRQRANRADRGITELRKYCDTTLIIPNETLLRITDANTSFTDALKLADSILHQATRGISDLINVHGMINLDFADVRTVMYNMGEAIMGTGIGHGEERAILAAQQAISSPLLQNNNITGAKGLLVNITGDSSITLHEVNDAASIINEEAGENANVIFGAVIDPRLTDEFRVTVIATGFVDEDGIDEVDEIPLPRTELSKRYVELPEQVELRTAEAEPGSPITGIDLTFSEGDFDDLTQYDDDMDVPAVLRTRPATAPSGDTNY